MYNGNITENIMGIEYVQWEYNRNIMGIEYVQWEYSRVYNGNRICTMGI